MFSFKKPIDFTSFVDKLNSGSENILAEIDLSEYKFETLPYASILENPDDIAAGVNMVKIKQRLSIFEVFENALIKYYDDGQVAYIFYTTTKNDTSIIGFSKTLFTQLGLGIYDSDRDFSFNDLQKVQDLAKGKRADKSIVNVWQTEKYSIVLQYRIHPLHQFSLIITKKIEKTIDLTMRKGTIYDLFSIDLNKLLLKEEISKEVNMLVDGSINCIDYKYALTEKALNVFDTITIRLFGSSKTFTLSTQTHLTFTTSKEIELKDKLKVCNSILQIYGSDINGYQDLEINEVEILENNEFWSGRAWHLNGAHGLYNYGDQEENVYSVSITNSLSDSGLTLSVLCYNKLLEYFTVN